MDGPTKTEICISCPLPPCRGHPKGQVGMELRALKERQMGGHKYGVRYRIETGSFAKEEVEKTITRRKAQSSPSPIEELSDV